MFAADGPAAGTRPPSTGSGGMVLSETCAVQSAPAALQHHWHVVNPAREACTQADGGPGRLPETRAVCDVNAFRSARGRCTAHACVRQGRAAAFDCGTLRRCHTASKLGSRTCFACKRLYRVPGHPGWRSALGRHSRRRGAMRMAFIAIWLVRFYSCSKAGTALEMECVGNCQLPTWSDVAAAQLSGDSQFQLRREYYSST